jgi:hypothetical protein
VEAAGRRWEEAAAAENSPDHINVHYWTCASFKFTHAGQSFLIYGSQPLKPQAGASRDRERRGGRHGYLASRRTYVRRER